MSRKWFNSEFISRTAETEFPEQSCTWTGASGWRTLFYVGKRHWQVSSWFIFNSLSKLLFIDSGVTLDILIRFCISVMEHNDKLVRQAGEKIIIWLYDSAPVPNFHSNEQNEKRSGLWREKIRAVLPQWTVEQMKSKRDFKYQHLFSILAQIDRGIKEKVPKKEAVCNLIFIISCHSQKWVLYCRNLEHVHLFHQARNQQSRQIPLSLAHRLKRWTLRIQPHCKLWVEFRLP